VSSWLEGDSCPSGCAFSCTCGFSICYISDANNYLQLDVGFVPPGDPVLSTPGWWLCTTMRSPDQTCDYGGCTYGAGLCTECCLFLGSNSSIFSSSFSVFLSVPVDSIYGGGCSSSAPASLNVTFHP
jgi:hypothetical protein